MRYDAVPTTNSIPLKDSDGLTPGGISLDLSSRKKIVIRPLLQRNVLSSGSVSSKTNLIVGTSIFSRKNQQKADAGTTNPDTTPAESPKVVQNPSQTSSRIGRTPPKGPKRDRISDKARVEKLAKVEHAKAHALLEKRCRVVVPQMAVAIPKPAPTVVVLNDVEGLSQFSEEYAKCGCTVDGRPPCQRCQFMRLTDKFCNLVNRQCEKWNIQI